MRNILSDIIEIFSNGRIIHKDDDLVYVELLVHSQNKSKIDNLDQAQLIEDFKDKSGNIIFSPVENEINNLVFVVQKLESHNFYWNFKDFINKNQFEKPDRFYIEDNRTSEADVDSDLMKGYLSILRMIDALSTNAKFRNEDFGGRTLYITNDSKIIELPIVYEHQAVYRLERSLIESIDYISSSLSENSEKKLLFLKELIDFLIDVHAENKFEYLILNFADFRTKCEASYEFYLGNFSYSKLKLEIDGTVMDYSKNIRGIINDSQGRLIAIPAAFIVAVTQMETANHSAFGFKNVGIIVSSYIFALLIDMFIVNQKSALSIIKENINNYKSVFRIKKSNQELYTPQIVADVLDNSFKPVIEELGKQESRLLILRLLNGTIPLAITIVAIIVRLGAFS